MNHREPPHLPVGWRRALHCLSLLLVPALSFDEGVAGTRVRSTARAIPDTTPYLPILGAPGLRIEEAPPPPDLVTRPAAAAPPVPAATPEEASVAAANADAARATLAGAEPTIAAEAATPPTAAAAAQVPPTGETRTPPPILPDTTRPMVRPEDFLPYFQIPGSARQPGEVMLVVPGVPSAPAPAPIPPSSATYTQSPR